jgi:Zn-finger protein
MANLLAKKILEKRTNDLVEEYDFEKRKKTHPEECICYKENKKCHDIENLNCFFCFCPNYNMETEEGKCKMSCQDGKYINTMKGKIFDCSACKTFHKKEEVTKYLIGKLYS